MIDLSNNLTLQGSIVFFVVLLTLVGASFLPFGRKKKGITLPSLIHGPKRLAYSVAFLFFGVGGLWAAIAPLSSAAIAPGVVSPEGRRLIVQHLEGGVIRKIHVVEGDRVKEGEPLVTLDNVRVDAEYSAALLEYIAGQIEIARIYAEQAHLNEIPLAESIVDHTDKVEVVALIRAAQQLHKRRAQANKARNDTFQGHVAQLNVQITGLQKIEGAITKQLRLVEDEKKDVEGLVQKKLTPLSRLRGLQREQARLEGELETALNDRVSALKQIENLSLENLELEQREQRDLTERLVQIRSAMSRAKGNLSNYEDEMERTIIRAPADGSVLRLNTTTNGGVIGPGDTVLELVPIEADLVIEARLNPQDIDDVHEGQKAKVILSAYRQRNMPTIHGSVRRVSPDRLVDPATQAPYFNALVEIPPEELVNINDLNGNPIELVPGMPAEVLITIGERTLMDYLFEPFFESLRRGLSEV